MQFKPITAIIVLFLVVASLSVSGCTFTTSPTTSPATPTPTVAATVAATATVKATAPPKATATPAPDYSSTLNSNPGWLGQGFMITTPFAKTTVNGRVAYVGSLTKTGYTGNVQVFPMSSYSDAVSYREQPINNYKAQGYTTFNTTANSWQGSVGTTVVDISALSSSIIGQPITMVMSINTA